MTTAGAEQAGLAAELAAAGRLCGEWQAAFAAVDRGAFLPRRVWVRDGDGYRPVDYGTDPVRWRAAAYADAPVVTQVADSGGAVAYRPTSSASMPRIVARMLHALDVRDGTRVLEAGTGTGYNAALLCARLGDSAVTTVEVDPHVAAGARAALRRAGYAPRCVVGDGSAGHPGGGPYDGLIATYAVRQVPPEWAAQLRPGGVLVVPWGSGLYNGVLLRLTARGDGTAAGPVVGDCAFMWDRGQAPAAGVMDVVGDGEAGAVDRTGLDPRAVLGVEDAAFAVGLLVPRVRYSVGHGEDGEFTLWLADAETGSWASVDYTPGAAEFEVEQHGPRMLWREVEAGHRWWDGVGRPERTRFGVTVGPGGDGVWLDGPARPVPALAQMAQALNAVRSTYG